MGGERFRVRRKPDNETERTETGQPVDVPARLRVVSADAYPDWEAVYRDNVDRVYRLMFAKVGNRSDAEDLTAEVFLTALRPMRISASVGEVRTYLLATARTVLATYWRRTLGREVTTLDDERVAAEFVTGVPVEPSTAPVIRAEAILAELPERYRRVLRLRFLEGRSLKEAAAELGVTVGNAKVLQHRALRHAAAVADRVET
ncbi:RNA polymerase sigma factor [Actinokineospora sp. NBRC 105648]|uniref:RNA polymerase sigma factor n=1 Tax=Actinokineospora sp. NBRC 105648 TaxID=3032206 RepID=UPI0024A1375A|nr:RNA polymerase sigma factor [Actinokineospora sp. NBRC 105648]GLZ38084.1 RNA polymerase sigma24 factor [Actinokineospora sp. NBRC 105648]